MSSAKLFVGGALCLLAVGCVDRSRGSGAETLASARRADVGTAMTMRDALRPLPPADPAVVAKSDCAVVDGRSSPIVVADDASRPARLAAAELQHYLRKITGVETRIVRESELTEAEAHGDLVLVGESARTRSLGLYSESFHRQQHLIRTVGRWLILMGRDGDERGPVEFDGALWPDLSFDAYRGAQTGALGSMYAVDTFLERSLGVRWYLPGDFGEVVPRTNVVHARALDVLSRPWSRYRAIGAPLAWDPFDFYARDRAPSRTVPQRDMFLWWVRLKMGGEPWFAGHSLVSYSERFGATHPEWFAGGKPGPGVHLCYGNAAVVAQQVQDARDYFDGKLTGGRFGNGGLAPAAGDYFGVAPQDSSTGWCDADKSWDAGPAPPAVPGAEFFNGRSSDYVWRFVDQVAREVGRTHPGKRVSATAYARYFLPPSFPIEPNVSVTVTRAVMLTTDPDARRYFESGLSEWRKRTTDLFVWDYQLNQWLEGFDAFPWIAPHLLGEDAKRLARQGVAGAFVETSPWQSRRANMAEDLLNVYVTARLLVDDAVDVDALLDEHYRLFYGPAQAPLKAFFSGIEREWQTHPNVLPGRTGALAWELFGTDAKLKGYRALLDEAARLASTEPFATRVRLVREAVLGPMESHVLRAAEDRRPRRRLPCPTVDAGPTVDGKLDDVAWRAASRTATFVGDALAAPSSRASARVVRDATTLYVAVEEPLATASGDADSVELAIDPDRARTGYFKLKIRPDGTAVPTKVGDDAKEAPWSATVRVASRRANGTWTLEAAIPFAAFGNVSPVGVWGFNVSRVAAPTGGPDRRTAWSPSFATAAAVHGFGILDFEQRGAARSNAPDDAPVQVVSVDFEDAIGSTKARYATPAGEEVRSVRLSNAAGGVAWADADRVAGKVGRAYEFKAAARRFAEVTLPEALHLGRDDWTASLWVRASPSAAGYLLVSTTAAPSWGLAVRRDAAGAPTLHFELSAGAPTVAVDAATPALTDGQWHSVVLSVARGGDASLYLDGSRVGHVRISQHKEALKPAFTIGGPYAFFDGAIDSLRIFRGSLTPERISAALKQ